MQKRLYRISNFKSNLRTDFLRFVVDQPTPTVSPGGSRGVEAAAGRHTVT